MEDCERPFPYESSLVVAKSLVMTFPTFCLSTASDFLKPDICKWNEQSHEEVMEQS